MLSVDDVNAILRLPLLGRHRRRAGRDRRDQQGRADRAATRARRPAKRIARSPRASAAPTRRRRRSRASRRSSTNCSGAAANHDRVLQAPLQSRAVRASRRANGCGSVLLSDHLALAPDVVESLKTDLIAVISKLRRRRRGELRRDLRAAESVRSRCWPTSRSLGMKPACQDAVATAPLAPVVEQPEPAAADCPIADPPADVAPAPRAAPPRGGGARRAAPQHGAPAPG